jgi:hypothetical protein
LGKITTSSREYKGLLDRDHQVSSSLIEPPSVASVAIEMRAFISLLAAALFTVPLANANVARADKTTTSHGALTTMRVVSQDGTIIYGEALGNKSGPHLILAHGFAASAVVFDSLFEDESLISKIFMVRLIRRTMKLFTNYFLGPL